MPSAVASMPSTSSSSLLTRAKRLGAGALLAVIPCASSQALTQLTLDYSASSNFSNSGWFTGTRDHSKADGLIIADGFKLWGGDSRTDGMFWRYDSEGNLENGYDTTGLAFVWGGKITGGASSDDKITAPFEFSFNFTDNDPVNSPYVTVRLEMGVRESAYVPDTTDGTNPSLPTNGNYNQTSWDKTYNAAGTYEETGEISVNLPTADASTELYWWTLLTVNWNSEFATYRTAHSQLSGDVLNVTIPQNSIDVTYLPSTSTPPPTSSVPDTGATLGLLGAAMAGMLALRRKILA